MNIIVKNTSNSNLSVFVRKNGRDEKCIIPPGAGVKCDDFETKTMRIYKKKGLIKIENSNTPSPQVKQEVVESKKETVVSDSENKKGPFKIELDPNDPTAFEVMESEVKQYVEKGFIKGAWSDEDVEFLRKNYPTKGRKFCANNLNRNESSVQKKINALGLKKKKKRK